MITEIFGILAGLLLILGGPPYFIDILKGRTKPQRATWFIWSALGVIAFISQVKLGAHWSLLFAGIDAVGSIAVFLLSLKFGVGGWTKIDKAALVIAGLGVVASLISHQATVALCGVVLADIAGAVLTILKTYRHPETETTITWLFVGTSSLLGALSVGKLSFALLLYPVYLTLANYSVVTAQLLGVKAHHGKLLFFK